MPRGIPGRAKCSMADCSNSCKAFGLCPTHYERFRRFGRTYNIRKIAPTDNGWKRGVAPLHGLVGTATYRSWDAMKSRCYNPNVPNYKNYGARGISVCQQWRESFVTFLKDMGERPPGTTLDRINNEGNYEPTNCRWATHKQQANNRRLTIRK